MPTPRKNKPYVFIIHSLGKFKEEIAVVSDYWRSLGFDVYDPELDTDQEDPSGGHRICKDNVQAIKGAAAVVVAWDGESKGSLFDLGAAFALNKPIYPILKCFPHATKGKSIINTVLEWHRLSPKE